MRKFGSSLWVCVQVWHYEFWRGPCICLASGAERLWCSYEMTPASRISRDMIFDEYASMADKRREEAITESDRGSRRLEVECDDADQSS